MNNIIYLENAGCNGGLSYLAFDYVIANAITTEDKYPYTGNKIIII